MPNWVFNTLSGYDNTLYEKYKSDDEESDIDFNKIIPEPEEITYTISGSINSTAINVYKHKHHKDDNVYTDPLYKETMDRGERIATDLGYLAIENPDKSLNEIFKDNKYSKKSYNDYVTIFGNNSLSHSDKSKAIDNYCKMVEKDFEGYKDIPFNADIYERYKSLANYGKALIELKEKYGCDNWYDWRLMNWGCKWNASETHYDEANQTLSFDTPWAPPEQIFAKIAEDNSKAIVDIYSEEEQGWYNEYQIKDGNLFITATGDHYYEYDDDGKIKSTNDNREEFDTPKLISFKVLKDEQSKFVDFVNEVM